MKVGTVLVALVFSVVVPAQQHSPKDSPSLSETIAWMNQTFNGGHRGLFQQWDRQTLSRPLMIDKLVISIQSKYSCKRF